MRVFFPIFILLCVIVPVSILAQTNSTFPVQMVITGLADTTPPSTPVLLSATPVATTQIDVVWGASTDDVALSGYVLLRDGTPIATTTLTSYSDTGLVASTTYIYAVQAFDTSFNYSSTSNSLATTTLPVVVTPTSTPSSGSQSTAARVVLQDFFIEPHKNSADFKLSTVHPARIEIRWGRTASYELGYVTSSVYSSNFASTIAELEPGTRYEYEVVGYTPIGVATVLKTGQFTTLSEYSSPSNVAALTAFVQGTDVELSWKNPTETEMAHVRIVRSHLGYPTSPTDGAIIYQGAGESFSDTEILSKYSPVYYSVFVYDTNGAVSSGAVIAVALLVNGSWTILPVDATGLNPIWERDGITVYDTDATTTDTQLGSAGIRIPDLREILVVTDESTQVFSGQKLTLPKDVSYRIVIPRNAVSRNLKTILLSFSDISDTRKKYSYILRLNAEQTAYEAFIQPQYVSGWSDFTIAVYDYEARIVSKYQKRIWFGAERQLTDVWFPDYIYQQGMIIFAFLLLVMSFAILLARRGIEDNAA